jgi:hypothetical protein
LISTHQNNSKTLKKTKLMQNKNLNFDKKQIQPQCQTQLKSKKHIKKISKPKNLN